MTAQAEAVNHDDVEFVTFSVADQNFCLEITQIREIRRWSPVTILPHAPPDVLGVMNLRGSVIPIYDLSARLGLGRKEITERAVIIVAAVEGKSVGLLVESVSEIASINANDIQETPDVKSKATRQSILGVISVGEDMTRVIDLNFVVEAAEETPA